MLREAWHLLNATVKEWLDDRVPSLGAALAFYCMLSLGPLLLVLLSLAGLFFGEKAAHHQIMSQIDGLIGAQGANAIEEVLAAGNERKDAGWLATIIGAVTLIVGASGVFRHLQETLNLVWGVEPKGGKGIWRIIRKRFLSFTMVLGTGFLLLVSLVLSAALAAVGEFGTALAPGMAPVWQVINQAVGFGVITAVFALLFKYLPDAEVEWRDVWIGAALTAALFTLGKFGIGLYLGQSAFGSIYGAAGSLVVLLVWVYYSSQILFFGAEFTQVYAKRQGRQIAPSAHAKATAH